MTNTMEMSTYLHCLYAEDVRNEASGQRTIVGAYAGRVNSVTFPVTMLKLAILADLALPVSVEHETIALELRLDDDLLQHIDLDASAAKQARDVALAEQLSGKIPARGYGIQFVFLINGLTVSRPGLLRVYALLDGKELRSNGFEFSLAGPPGQLTPQ